MNTPRELAARFPYQFNGPNHGLGITGGWFPLFSKLCEDVDVLLRDDKQNFHWRQVKEKFGTGRFYWDLGRTKGPLHIDIKTPDGILSVVNDPSQKQSDAEKAALMKSIGELLRAAERQTACTCAVCGAPGALDRGNGYFLTLCPAHVAARQEDPKSSLGLWFESEDEFPSTLQSLKNLIDGGRA